MKKNEILALIEKIKDISPIYQKLLSVSPKTLLEESNWDAVERKKYLRRYFELLFNFVTKKRFSSNTIRSSHIYSTPFSADLLQSIQTLPEKALQNCKFGQRIWILKKQKKKQALPIPTPQHKAEI